MDNNNKYTNKQMNIQNNTNLAFKVRYLLDCLYVRTCAYAPPMIDLKAYEITRQPEQSLTIDKKFFLALPRTMKSNHDVYIKIISF